MGKVNEVLVDILDRVQILMREAKDSFEKRLDSIQEALLEKPEELRMEQYSQNVKEELDGLFKVKHHR